MITINYYEQNNAILFNELKELCSNPNKLRTLHMLFKKPKKHLGEWINSFQLFIQTPEKIAWSTKVYCILHGIIDFPRCLVCNKQIFNVSSFKHGFKSYCCIQCVNSKQSLRTQHSIQTCINRYGHQNFGQGKQARIKSKQTCLKLYGVEYFSNPIKSKQTCLNKYGVENISQLESIKEQKKNSCLEHFGVAYPMQSIIIQNKSKQSCLEHFGVAYPMQSLSVQKKCIETCNRRYGCDNPSQCYAIRSKMRTSYKYDNKNISTFPELAFYIYLKDHNYNFQYQPNEPKLFYIFNNKKHRYFPDFLVDGKLYEIKGPHLVDKNGIWTTPKSNKWSIEKYNQILLQLQEKQKCAINNGVIIIYENNYKKYIDYVITHYDIAFLKGLKNK